MIISKQQRIQRIFKQLPSEQQATLLAFAEFLHARLVEQPEQIPIPQIKPRLPDETVVGAIKRLAQSYPMLDKAVMLNETSHLMTEFMVQGRDKMEVIDELEAVFLRHYNKLIKEETI